jgi:hypothetical protein
MENYLGNHQTQWTSFNIHTETQLTSQNGQIKQIRDESARAHTVYHEVLMRLKERMDGLTLQMVQLEERSLAPSIPLITSNNGDFELYEERLTDVERLLQFLKRDRN